MSADTAGMRARLKLLANKHRIAHVAALIRREQKCSTRTAELTALLRALLAAPTRDGRG
jgi:hypothetical protein